VTTTAPVAGTDLYRAHFEALSGDGVPGWVQALRADAFERFAARGFPGPREEAWRHTNVAPIAKAAFAQAEPGRSVPAERLRQLDFGGAFTGWELVFVDGRFSPALSSASTYDGVRILSLREALSTHADQVRAHIARLAPPDAADPFRTLSLALLADGAFVELSPGVAPTAPVHLVFYSTGDAARPAATHPRTLVLAGRGSHATVIETYAGAEGGLYFTNAVTEIVVGEGARVDHFKLQREAEGAFHVSTLAVELERDATFSDHNVCVGGALVRQHVEARFAGTGGDCALFGLSIGDGTQHHDTHTVVDHAVPHCTSRELYKGVLGGRSRGVFHGKIVVREDAQKTNAHQSNRNLLLSRHALVNSTPALEIHADDVKCKHGSTTGQLDPLALFYLRSRGIGEQDAKSLLTYAFASDLVSRITVQPVRVALEAFLHHRLPASATEAAS
jgi:Fe-S cluster assembly protein SufD